MCNWSTHPKWETTSRLFRENLQTLLSKCRLIKITPGGERLCFWKAAIFTSPCQPASRPWGRHRLTFVRDKLERVAEDSKARESLLRAVVQKLVSQPVATLAAQDLHLSHVLNVNVPSGMFQQENWQHRTGPLASDVPCRQWESPSSWWRCPPWWFPWKLAKETSGRTWSDWRTAGGYTGSIRTYLQEGALEVSVAFST